jgi:hypothetical protein
MKITFHSRSDLVHRRLAVERAVRLDQPFAGFAAVANSGWSRAISVARRCTAGEKIS